MGAVLEARHASPLDLFPHPPTLVERARAALRGPNALVAGMATAAAIASIWSATQFVSLSSAQHERDSLRAALGTAAPAIEPMRRVAEARADYARQLEFVTDTRGERAELTGRCRRSRSRRPLSFGSTVFASRARRAAGPRRSPAKRRVPPRLKLFARSTRSIRRCARGPASPAPRSTSSTTRLRADSTRRTVGPVVADFRVSFTLTRGVGGSSLMAADVAQVRAWTLRYRFQSGAVAVALVALIGFVALGVRAQRAAQPVHLETARLRMADEEIYRFRTAFFAGRPEQELRVARLADSLGVAISRDNRVALAQRVAARAESLGLARVRVKFAPGDSAVPPRRPDLSSSSVNIADYTLVLDCDGGLAAVLSLLNQLPPSIALERLTGAKSRGASQFRLTFAVFESGAAPGRAAEQREGLESAARATHGLCSPHVGFVARAGSVVGSSHGVARSVWRSPGCSGERATRGRCAAEQRPKE